MKITVKDLQVLSVENKESEVFEIEGKEFTVKPHVCYTCYDSSSNNLVKIRDFLFDLNLENGDIIDHEFNVFIKKLDNK